MTAFSSATNRMRRLLIAAFCAFVLLSLSILGAVVFYLAKQTLVDQAVQHLDAIATAQTNAVETVTKIWLDRLKLIASRTQLRISLRDWQETGKEDARAKVQRIIKDAKSSVPAVTWIGIIGRDRVLAGATEAPPAAIASYVETAYEAGRIAPVLLDLSILAPWGVQALMAAPMVLDDEFVGVTVAAVDPTELFAVMTDYTGLGETGETLLAKRTAGGDALIMTPIRFDPTSAFVHTVASDRDDRPITHALRGNDRSFISGSVDYNGQAVLAVTRHLPETNWGLVAKIDRAEVLIPITRLRNRLLLSYVAIFLLGLALAAYLSKRLTQGLADKEEQIDAFINTAVDAIVTIDDRGHIMRFNSSAETMFGYAAAEVGGRNVRMLMDSDHAERHDQYIDNYLRTGEARIIGIGRELIGKRRNGALFPIELGVSESCVGGMRFFTGSIRDISERKEAEAQREELVDQLRVSNQELERFAYIASHDLRAPLRALSILPKWISRDIKKANVLLPVIDEHLGDMKIQVERMDRLLTDLLEYSLVGTVSGLVSMVDPEKVVENVCVLLQLPPGFEVVVEGDLPAVEVISTEFELVLRNLISNAIKHHDWDHGRIAVRGGFDGLDLFFEVSDDGPGIAPDHHQRIFEMFSTLRSRDEVEGSGMGLALIKKIVEGWGGRIAVISDAERRGTTFRFTMRATARAAA